MTSDKDTIIENIIQGDLQILYNLIEPIQNDTPQLKQAYIILKYGKKIKYHIEYNLRNQYDLRDRQKTVLLNGQQYPLEDWWDEEETRRIAARKALLEHYGEDEQIYQKR